MVCLKDGVTNFRKTFGTHCQPSLTNFRNTVDTHTHLKFQPSFWEVKLISSSKIAGFDGISHAATHPTP